VFLEYLFNVFLNMFYSVSLMKQVKDTMHKAFWELLREQLNSDPPVYSQAMILLSEIQIVCKHFYLVLLFY